jgi:hypothetical protein
MNLEVLTYVIEGYTPLYMIDLKKFNLKTKQIEIDGYMEVIREGVFFSNRTSIRREFLIRAKREKVEAWNNFKNELYLSKEE